MNLPVQPLKALFLTAKYIRSNASSRMRTFQYLPRLEKEVNSVKAASFSLGIYIYGLLDRLKKS